MNTPATRRLNVELFCSMCSRSHAAGVFIPVHTWGKSPTSTSDSQLPGETDHVMLI